MPYPAARALASKRSDHVAILIPNLSNALFVDLLDAAQQTLRGAGSQALIGVTHYDSAQEEQLLREQLLHRPAGVSITGLHHSDATRALISSSQVPCMHLMDLPPPQQDELLFCVGFRQIDAGAAMTRHLLARGRRRIAFAGAQPDEHVMQRLCGWRGALQEAGLYDSSLEWLNPASPSLALGGAMLQEIVAARPGVDAIFFCNSDLAQGALLAALRIGGVVPGRVAIAGFNDLTGSDQIAVDADHRAHAARADRPRGSRHAAVADAGRHAGAALDRPRLRTGGGRQHVKVQAGRPGRPARGASAGEQSSAACRHNRIRFGRSAPKLRGSRPKPATKARHAHPTAACCRPPALPLPA